MDYVVRSSGYFRRRCFTRTRLPPRCRRVNGEEEFPLERQFDKRPGRAEVRAATWLC